MREKIEEKVPRLILRSANHYYLIRENKFPRKIKESLKREGSRILILLRPEWDLSNRLAMVNTVEWY